MFIFFFLYIYIHSDYKYLHSNVMHHQGNIVILCFENFNEDSVRVMVLNASFNNSPFNIMAVDFIDGENRSIQRKVVTLAMGELLVMTGTHYTCSCKFYTITTRTITQ